MHHSTGITLFIVFSVVAVDSLEKKKGILRQDLQRAWSLTFSRSLNSNEKA